MKKNKKIVRNFLKYVYLNLYALYNKNTSKKYKKEKEKKKWKII